MYSTTRDPVPIRANGCPDGKTPLSMDVAFDVPLLLAIAPRV
jgi:hypothetical protein